MRGEESPYYAHPTAVVAPEATVGNGTKIWHFCHLMPGCSLGEACNIGQNVVIAPGVKLGRNVKVQNNVSLYTGVQCEDDVFIGPSAVFTNVINPRSFVERKAEFRSTLLRKGATIGANATVLCGVTIGEFALVGAGTVVLQDVPPYALVVGNPARQVGWVSRDGYTLRFDQENVAYCPEENRSYALRDGRVIPQ